MFDVADARPHRPMGHLQAPWIVGGLMLVAAVVPAGAHPAGVGTAGPGGATVIPHLSHGQMRVIADYRSEVMDLAATRAQLIHLRVMPGKKEKQALVTTVELAMLDDGASLVLCQCSNETFNTAEVIGPRWRDIPFHDPSSMAIGGTTMAAIGLSAIGLAEVGRRNRNGASRRAHACCPCCLPDGRRPGRVQPTNRWTDKSSVSLWRRLAFECQLRFVDHQRLPMSSYATKRSTLVLPPAGRRPMS